MATALVLFGKFLLCISENGGFARVLLPTSVTSPAPNLSAESPLSVAAPLFSPLIIARCPKSPLCDAGLSLSGGLRSSSVKRYVEVSIS